MASRILVVDDDADFAEAISRVLAAAGFPVDTASHFEPALRLLEGGTIDLLLVDIVMPGGVNGVALARMGRMRRSDLIIIYLTGHDIPGVERELAGPLIRKPVDGETLVAVIREAIASAAASAAAGE